MMKAYITYKEWWIKTITRDHGHRGYRGSTVEEAFEQHVEDLGLYELMETLVVWEK
jgi:hypothetical protein